MQTIMNQLKREEDDLVGHRGLLPQSDQQTFQMFIPSQLRLYYNKVMPSLNIVSKLYVICFYCLVINNRSITSV